MAGKLLAFCVEAREGWWEMKGKYREDLQEGETIWDRPDLWGFAGGAIEDMETGLVQLYGPDEAAAMVSRLDEADIVTSYAGYANDLDILSLHGDVSRIKLVSESQEGTRYPMTPDGGWEKGDGAKDADEVS